MIIAYRMLLVRSSAIWPDVLQAMQVDKLFGRALVASLAYQHNVTTSLSEGALADLYVWLVDHYPH